MSATTIRVNEDGHLRGRYKLKAVAYLLSEMDPETSIAAEACHGLAWIIEDAVAQMSIGLNEPDGDA